MVHAAGATTFTAGVENPQYYPLYATPNDVHAGVAPGVVEECDAFLQKERALIDSLHEKYKIEDRSQH